MNQKTSNTEMDNNMATRSNRSSKRHKRQIRGSICFRVDTVEDVSDKCHKLRLLVLGDSIGLRDFGEMLVRIASMNAKAPRATVDAFDPERAVHVFAENPLMNGMPSHFDEVRICGINARSREMVFAKYGIPDRGYSQYTVKDLLRFINDGRDKYSKRKATFQTHVTGKSGHTRAMHSAG